MITIIAGTNRPQSNSFKVAKFVEPLYKKEFNNVSLFDLSQVGLQEVDGSHYAENKPKALTDKIELINQSEGLVVICPEYNGSMPGALKYFIDHWSFPESFEFRPVAFIGLGGIFGGLRPVEHLQQVFGYRNAFIYPERIMLINVWNILKDGKITDKVMSDLIVQQTQGFSKYIRALNQAKLSACYR